MDRRRFMHGALGVAGLVVPWAGATGVTGANGGRRALEGGAGPRPRGRPFGLRFAPHLGMFRHHAGDDPVEQLRFMADEGFQAFEDNGMAGRTVEEQERLASAMERLGIEMGVFVAHADFQGVTFASDDPAQRERILADMRRAVEVARRVRARWCTVVPGCASPGVPTDYQTASVVENLRRAAEVCAESGLIMVLEALNPWRDHPGLFLRHIPQAFQICRAVDHPCCKILDDLYHQQISEGNLIPNIDRAWDEIAYFQVGDNPGRNEPGTGEIHFKNVFAHLARRGFQGLIGMEHGNSLPGKEGERAVIEAYRACDPA